MRGGVFVRRFEPVPGVRIHPLVVHSVLALAAFALIVAPPRWRGG